MRLTNKAGEKKKQKSFWEYILQATISSGYGFMDQVYLKTPAVGVWYNVQDMEK